MAVNDFIKPVLACENGCMPWDGNGALEMQEAVCAEYSREHSRAYPTPSMAIPPALIYSEHRRREWFVQQEIWLHRRNFLQAKVNYLCDKQDNSVHGTSLSPKKSRLVPNSGAICFALKNFKITLLKLKFNKFHRGGLNPVQKPRRNVFDAYPELYMRLRQFKSPSCISLNADEVSRFMKVGSANPLLGIQRLDRTPVATTPLFVLLAHGIACNGTL
ncbi:hypothetical protein B0H19DRAFT_1079706 [Mycena capillaripes]|nr:hypothetical protein B0H19DRAFT_1079706 [Mycena capillaripes]